MIVVIIKWKKNREKIPIMENWKARIGNDKGRVMGCMGTEMTWK